MTLSRSIPLSALLLALAPAFAGINEARAQERDPHRQQAYGLAGLQFHAFAKRLCSDKEEPVRQPLAPVKPTRVFDNLVFLGSETYGWNGWALLTSDGIIVFDPQANDLEAERDIIQGLRSVGLDPQQTRHIVIMHGHADHYGGAPYVQERTGAQVHMSAIDWTGMETLVVPAALASARRPTQASFIGDGDVLTLGDTSVRFFLTPGHTAGTLSALFTVRDGDQAYTAAYRGGTSVLTNPQLVDAYAQSNERFARIVAEAGAQVLISNHPDADVTAARLPALASRAQGAPHPFVLGEDGVARLMTIAQQCILSIRGQLRAAN
jgi:metallo-beta-lactamase class B